MSVGGTLRFDYAACPGETPRRVEVSLEGFGETLAAARSKSLDFRAKERMSQK